MLETGYSHFIPYVRELLIRYIFPIRRHVASEVICDALLTLRNKEYKIAVGPTA
jgi:hypothetical protein